MGDIPEEAMEWTKRKGSGVWKNWSATKDDPTERITDSKINRSYHDSREILSSLVDVRNQVVKACMEQGPEDCINEISMMVLDLIKDNEVEEHTPARQRHSSGHVCQDDEGS